MSTSEKWYGAEAGKRTLSNFLQYVWAKECKPGSDIIIHLPNGGKFEAHRLILACSSKYFENLLAMDATIKDHDLHPQTDLPESYWEDSVSHKKELILGPHTLLNIDLFKHILKFMYTLEIEVTPETADRFWAIGEVLGMPHLQKVCVERDSKCMERGQKLLDTAIPEEHKQWEAPKKVSDAVGVDPTSSVTSTASTDTVKAVAEPSPPKEAALPVKPPSPVKQPEMAPQAKPPSPTKPSVEAPTPVAPADAIKPPSPVKQSLSPVPPATDKPITPEPPKSPAKLSPAEGSSTETATTPEPSAASSTEDTTSASADEKDDKKDDKKGKKDAKGSGKSEGKAGAKKGGEKKSEAKKSDGKDKKDSSKAKAKKEDGKKDSAKGAKKKK